MSRRSSMFAAGVVLAALCLFAFVTLAGSARADGGDLAEVRIAVRVGDDGRVEFGLRTRNPDGDWSDPILPRARRFPVEATVDRWLSSSAVTVPAGVESDLSVRVVDGSFVVRADGLNYEDVCGFVSLRRSSRIVSLTAEHPPACDEIASPVTVLSVADFRPEFDPDDPQQHLVYDWESHLGRSVHPTYLQNPITLAGARAIARAVYSDHFRGRELPPSMTVVGDNALDGLAGIYRARGHVIELTSAGLNTASVLHELGHALVQSAGVRTGHGPPFVAQMLALWQRYLPDFDAAAALRAAADHDVVVAASPPAAATGGLVQLGAAQAALGVPDDSTLAVGVAPGLRGVAELEDDIVIRITARLLEDDRIEFALQPRTAGGEWGGRLYPSIRFLPVDPPRGRWLSSSPVLVAPKAAAASVRVRDDAFVFRVGGQDLTDPCGNTSLLRGSRAVWFSSLDHETCREWSDWTPILFAADSTLAALPHAPAWHISGDWLRHLRLNRVLPDGSDREITISEATALAEALFVDHFGDGTGQPITFSTDSSGARAEYRVHSGRNRWFDVWWTGDVLTQSFVVGFVARSIVDLDKGYSYVERRTSSDSAFIAQLIALWERYLPNFNGDTARRAAQMHSLRFDMETPVPATGSLFDRAVVRTLLGVR